MEGLKKDSLSKQVCMLIAKDIKDGIYEIGTKIPTEPALMEKYQVSRNTLREAIKELQAQGLVAVKQGSGTYVINKDPFRSMLNKKYKEISEADIIEARSLLEVRVSELAAERRNEEDLKNIKEALENYRNKRSLENDLNFHLEIAKASHNELLYELYRSMLFYLETVVILKHEESILSEETIFTLHEELFIAIVSMNIDDAKIAALNILKI